MPDCVLCKRAYANEVERGVKEGISELLKSASANMNDDFSDFCELSKSRCEQTRAVISVSQQD